MQFSPTTNLSKYIKHYLIFQISDGDGNRYRHFANGHNGLVFSFNKTEIAPLNSKNSLPESFVFGQLSEYQDFFTQGATYVVIVIFQPLGLFALTGIYSSKFTNQIEEASIIFGKEIIRLHENLFYSLDTLQMIDFLNSFFTKKIDGLYSEFNPYLLNIISLATYNKGDISISNLCEQTGLNERKIQRLFFEQIGLPPIKFIRNIKLHYFLGLARKKEQSSLTELSLEAGYYDQAHLNREFKKAVGLNPSLYLKSGRLAVNLIQI